MPAFEIQVFAPLMTMEDPSRRAVVCIAARSEPASASEIANAAMCVPSATPGRYFLFSGSEPNSEIGPEPRPCMANANSARPEA